MYRKLMALAFSSLLVSTNAIASTYCGPADVKAIQTEKAHVFVYISNGTWSAWKSIGKHGDDKTRSSQALAQQSMATGATVTLRYQDGYDCSTDDYGGSIPNMVRLNI